MCGMEEHAHTEECYPHAEPEETVESELIDDSAPSDDQNEDITGEDITSGEDDGNTEFSEMPEDGADAEDGDAAEVPGADEGNTESETPEADEENAESEAPEADEGNADSETPGADGENSDVEAERNGEDNTEAEFQEEDQTDEEILETPEDHENNSDSGDETTPEYICGLEEHTHGEECYDEEGNLICELEEHIHTEACVSAEVAAEEPAEEEEVPEYICGLEEHVHGEECYDEEGNLICELEEHTHTEECVPVPEDEPEEEEDIDCFDELYICGKEEHTHSAECYDEEGNLICGLEEHIHDETCLAAEDETVTLQAEGENVRAAATFAKGVLPDETTMRVALVEQSEEEMALLKENAKSRGYDVLSAHSYDVSFLDADGEEIEPEGEVSVSMEFIKPLEGTTEEISEENTEEDTAPEIAAAQELNADEAQPEEAESLTAETFTAPEDSSDGKTIVIEEEKTEICNVSWQLLHVKNDAELENLTNEDTTEISTDDGNSVNGIAFESDSFSEFVIVQQGEEGTSTPEEQFINAFSNPACTEVKLETDVEVAANITLNRAITLDLNGHILKADGNLVNSMFDIGDNGDLTITDSAWDSSGDEDSEVADNPTNYSASYDPNNKKLIYYVMHSSTPNSTRGTSETTRKHEVTGAGVIEGNANASVFYISGTGKLTIENGMITGSKRAVYMSGGILDLNGGYLCGFKLTDTNDGIFDYGGAIWANGGVINQRNSVLAANESPVGGAIYAGGKTEINISGGVISGNLATAAGSTGDGQGDGIVRGGGGGIFCNGNVNINMTNGYVTYNRAITPNYFNGGGGIFIAGSSNLSVSNGYITGNYSGSTGGGVYTKFGDSTIFVMTGGHVSGNVAANSEGGGIAIDRGGVGHISSGVITNNETRTDQHWGGGGVFCADGGYLYMTNVLVTKNTADGFGGGVAGCSTGRVYICVNEGGAIFENSARGEKGSGDSSSKSEDQLYAFNSDVFKNNGYQDYFCALNSAVEGTMLGGGNANWHGSADGTAVSAGKGERLEANYVMGLTSSPSQYDKNAAVEEAHVYVNGNKSSTHGGGILCNGYLIMGNPTEVKLGSSLELSGTKNLFDTNGRLVVPQEQDKFRFTLIDRYGTEVAMGTNDQFGEISFDNRLPFDAEGEYIYYLKENTSDDVSIMTDSTVYRITVNIIKQEDLLNGSNVNRIWYKIDGVKVEKKVLDNTGAEEWANVNFILGNITEQHAVTLKIENDGATFTNHEVSHREIVVEKKWADNKDSHDSVTVILKKNGDEYAQATLSNENGWRYFWDGLPAYEKTEDSDELVPCNYSVEELPVEGYVSNITVTDVVGGESYWVPATTLEAGKKYIIVGTDSSGNNHVLKSPLGSKDAWFDAGNSMMIQKGTENLNIGVYTYTDWYAGNSISAESIFTPQLRNYNEKLSGLILKNAAQDSWLRVQGENENDRSSKKLKGTSGAQYASFFTLEDGKLKGTYTERRDWYYSQYILYNKKESRFDAMGSEEAEIKDITDAVELYTLAYKKAPASETFTITNTPVEDFKGSLELTKVGPISLNTDNVKPLSGAEFKLYKAEKVGEDFVVAVDDNDKKIVMTFAFDSKSNRYNVLESMQDDENYNSQTTLTTGTNGKLYISDVPYGDYILVETKAPEGYAPVDTHISVDGSQKIVKMNITDELGFTLPNTGGNGTYRYTLGGLLLMMAAVMYKLIQLRKEVK